jgi:L-fuculose-phosphate aldolase
MAASIDDLRTAVAVGCRILGANGHDDFVWGHLSVRDPGGRGIWMKASSYGFEEIGEPQVILVSFDGEVLEGEGRAHIEWPIHTEVLQARPDLHAVVHSHPPGCLAVAAADQPLRPVSHAATMFVPPEVPRFTQTAELIVTTQLGRDVATTMGAAQAMFLVNHGIVVAGIDVRDAVVRAVLLEKACQQQILTEEAGGVRIWSSDEEALAKRATVWSELQVNALWTYLQRRLG